ncbi:hypothetical protein E2C01_041897 [Portunus trituberculatus]|uniref:Uncharacterized protein n=1 Tax=Portunus trituberculatus TaxID=210409 RepID=A0A5B7FL26_PORTR|nr:hypothetical protein [Portunus trituberculatus]
MNLDVAFYKDETLPPYSIRSRPLPFWRAQQQSEGLKHLEAMTKLSPSSIKFQQGIQLLTSNCDGRGTCPHSN